MVSADGGITQSLTKTGQILGSPLYMSPEQSTADTVTHSTDIYSLGILMYECLTGAPPFRGDNSFATVMMHNEVAPKPFDRTLGINGGLEAIVMKALEKDPVNRFQSMQELKLALLNVFSQDIVQAIPSTAKTSTGLKSTRPNESIGADKTNKKLIAIIGGSVVALLVLGGGALSLTKLKNAAVSRSTQNATSMLPTTAAVQTANPAPSANVAADPAMKNASVQIDADLPNIPDSVQLPVADSRLAPQELVNKGISLGQDKSCPALLPARYFRTALEREPSLVKGYDALGGFYWKQQGLVSGEAVRVALENCKKVYTAEIKYTRETDGYWARANAEKALNQLPEVLADYDTILKVHPGDNVLHLKHAVALCDLKRFPEAISEMEKYLRKQDTKYMYCYGNAYRDSNMIPQSIEAMTRWIKKAGPIPALLSTRAASEKDLGRYAAAIADYNAIAKVDRKDYERWLPAIDECKKLLAAQSKRDLH
jgi:tetratricopeptide (TPR) repeat protein